MKTETKTIGIIGGMGPLATADLFKKIILLTDANSDSEHIPIVIDNNTRIPDRTTCILNGGEDPTKQLIRSAIGLEKMGADVLIMPCNTAHYFYKRVKEYVEIPFLHMIEETAKEIQKDNEGKIGLLATEGTYEARVYDEIFEKYGIELVKPEPCDMKYVMELIYHVKKTTEPMDLTHFKKVLCKLEEKGVKKFILGCTELPVAFELFDLNKRYSCIDPTKILALRAIEFTGKRHK